MPTTFSNLVPVRRVAVGDCSGPLGSGFDALARSAYTALRAAEWTQSADPPFLPVHDNGQTANKTIPRGDAWKCSYGYDDAARTERSACGAVCYTFALPADAYSGTPANISTVSLSLTGDRYLDAGVDLYLVPSASATPPSISDLLALTPVGTYCATSDQSPTKPNERHGVTEAVEATPGVAAQPYLHIALLLHDYTTNRGAWIEGGAMLEGAAATIAFSREVAADAPAAVPSVRMLLVTAQRADSYSGMTDLEHLPRAFAHPVFSYYSFTPDDMESSDIRSIIGLAYRGTLPAISAWGFPDTNFRLSISGTSGFYFTDEFAWVNLFADEFAYHAAPCVPGTVIECPTISCRSGAGGGTFRAALVQHSYIADPGTEYPTATDISNMPPINQVADGAGPDVIAIADGSIEAEGTASLTLSVVATPSKPYVSLVLLPLERGMSISCDIPPVLVASMPTT
jgi:hypothetical protein